MRRHHGGLRLQHRHASADDAARPDAKSAACRQTDHKMMRLLSIILALNAIAFGQSAGRKAIDGAAQALGGKDKLLAIQTLTIEGSGTAPNIGQNPFPEGPLPTWWIPEFKRTIDLAHHRSRTDQHRIGMFPFALSTDVRQTQCLD